MEGLQQQLQEREKLIQTMKEKTKLYVEKLRHEHAEALEQEKAQTRSAQVDNFL